MLISTNTTREFKTRKFCLIALVTSLALVLIILLIVGFTVFKPKNAVTTVNSISVKGFHASLDVPRVRVDLNITLAIDLSVKNPNRVGFKYKNATALLFYKGDDNIVGEAPILAGYISPGETIGLNTTLTVLADRLLSDSEFYSDVMNGTLPLTSYTRISGTVVVLKVFKHLLVSYSWCDVILNVANRTVSNSECRYKTKL